MNLNVSDKHLNSLIKKVVADKLGATVTKLNFIGGGSNGKVYCVETNDSRKFAVKAFRIKGAMQKETNQMLELSKHTKTCSRFVFQNKFEKKMFEGEKGKASFIALAKIFFAGGG